jgi:hypothetical protein
MIRPSRDHELLCHDPVQHLDGTRLSEPGVPQQKKTPVENEAGRLSVADIIYYPG